MGILVSCEKQINCRVIAEGIVCQQIDKYPQGQIFFQGIIVSSCTYKWASGMWWKICETSDLFPSFACEWVYKLSEMTWDFFMIIVFLGCYWLLLSAVICSHWIVKAEKLMEVCSPSSIPKQNYGGRTGCSGLCPLGPESSWEQTAHPLCSTYPTV